MMKVSSKAYIENLSLFSQKLREHGVASGIKETMDAAKLINIMGLYDRDTIRHALCSIYAKSEREQRLFYETFDNFFVGKNVQQKQVEQQIEEEENSIREYEKAMEDLQYEGKPLEIREELKSAYANLPMQDREQLMKYLNFATDNMRHSPFNERFMVKAIEQRLKVGDSIGENSEGLPKEISDLLFKNLSDITEEEIPKVILLIQMLVKKINGAISREYHKAGKSGRLDFRGTIHESLRTGGSFYKLVYKKRRRSKKRIILLCDVSGSMLKVSQFAIRFIKSMNDVAKGSETYLFSEGLQKVNSFMLNNMNTFENHVKESGLWGKGTDFGNALEDLMKACASHLTSSSVLIIISDTKTVNLQLAETNLKKVSKRAGKIIWMNPIPEEKWSSTTSIVALKPYCQMLDCSTLNNLAKACTRLI